MKNSLPATDNSFPSDKSRFKNWKLLFCLIVAFIVSRVIFLFIGIRFDTWPLDYFWTFIEPDLLRNNLFESLYYLHSQPPLFNLFLGIILKMLPGYEILAFESIYMILGLIIIVSMFVLMTKLGVSVFVSVSLTVLFMVSPACILYENYLVYTYPVTALLCLSALFLHEFLSSTKLRYGIAFFMLLSFVSLTRSLFHLSWFALVVAILIVFQKRKWKKIVAASCVPFLFIALWYTKNAFIFGTFSSSSWIGMNLSRITIRQLPEDKRESLAREGEISKLSLIIPFSHIEKYRPYLTKIRKTGVEVLDREKKVSGASNLNNIAYIEISRLYLRDDLYVITSYPSSPW